MSTPTVTVKSLERHSKHSYDLDVAVIAGGVGLLVFSYGLAGFWGFFATDTLAPKPPTLLQVLAFFSGIFLIGYALGVDWEFIFLLLFSGS